MYKRILNQPFLKRLTPVITGGRDFMPATHRATWPLNVPESILGKYRAFLSRLYFRKEADRWRFSQLALEFALPFIVLKKEFSRVSQKITRQINPVSYIFKNYVRQDRIPRSQSHMVFPTVEESQVSFLRDHPLFQPATAVVYKNMGMRIIERFQRSAGMLAKAGSGKRDDRAYQSPRADLQFQIPGPPAVVRSIGKTGSERMDIPGAAFSQAAALSPVRKDAPAQSPLALKYQRFNRALGVERMPKNLQKNSFQYLASGSLLNAVTKNLHHSLSILSEKYSRLQRERKAIGAEQKFVQRKLTSGAVAGSGESAHPVQNINFDKTAVLTHKISEKQDSSESAPATQNRKSTRIADLPPYDNMNASDTGAPIKLARPLGITDPQGGSLNGEPDMNRMAEAVYTLIEKKLRVERERRGIFF